MNATAPDQPDHERPLLGASGRLVALPVKSALPMTPQPDDSRSCWQGIRTGDRAAFEVLYRLHARALARYARRLTADDDRVWDAIHDVFADIWKYQAALNPDADPRFYLMRSLRNRLMHYQKNAFLLDEDLIEPESEPATESRIITQEADTERIRRLHAAVNQLSERQQQIVRLRFFDNLSYDQIAVRLQLSKQGVYNHIYKAMTSLRSLINSKS